MILSVSEISSAIKLSIDTRFQQVSIRGEISGYKGRHSSGHAFFSLKDESNKIDSVIWKSSFHKFPLLPEEGMEIIASGHITCNSSRSSYSFVIENFETTGQGTLTTRLESRKKKLQEEGLFEEARKRPLPLLPKTIAIVTSPSGAVISDMIQRLLDRYPCHVLLWPVAVQGQDCVSDVVNAIRGLNHLVIQSPDVIIIARGGGSLEDLWPFNDEAIVRAVADSRIPIISAIGHEPDWTLIDYVADLRAPTPTAAAELVAPSRKILRLNLENKTKNLRRAYERFLDQKKHSIKLNPKILIERHSLNLQRMSVALSRYNVQGMLDRGYALALRDDNSLISSSLEVKSIPSFNLRFKDGVIKVAVPQ